MTFQGSIQHHSSIPGGRAGNRPFRRLQSEILRRWRREEVSWKPLASLSHPDHCRNRLVAVEKYDTLESQTNPLNGKNPSRHFCQPGHTPSHFFRPDIYPLP